MKTKLYPSLLYLLIALFSTPAIFAQDINASLDHDGLTRDYILHVPPSYDASNDYPLILALHGLGDVISNFSNVGFSAIADTANFLVVYPQAETSLLGTAWNNGTSSFGITLNEDVDDTGFLEALIDEISSEYSVDAQRVYATGFSMGSIMTHRLGCELHDRIAAIAGVAGPIADIIASNCALEHGVPVMHMHGTNDGTVDYDNGDYLGGADAGLQGAEEVIEFWVGQNNCNSAPVQTDVEDLMNDGITIEKYVYSSCDDDVEVILYKEIGAEHVWLNSSNDIIASEEIWLFFNNYTLPAVSNNEEVAAIEAKIFPNPVIGELQIEVSKSISQLSITNSIGAIVHQQNDNFDSTIRVNMQDFNPGIYFVQLKSGSQISTYKVVKL